MGSLTLVRIVSELHPCTVGKPLLGLGLYWIVGAGGGGVLGGAVVSRGSLSIMSMSTVLCGD